MDPNSPESLAISWIATVRALGGNPALDADDRVRVPRQVWRQLGPEQMGVWREHRSEIKSALREQVPTAAAEVAPPPEQEPEMWVGSRRVTEADVLSALASEGDEVVADYRSGRLSKWDAYYRARCSLRQIERMRHLIAQ